MPLLDIAAWWAEKVLFEQIFWAIALPSTLIFLIILVGTFTGVDGGMDGDVDLAIETDAGAGFQFFTLKNLIGFFTIFSWVGIGCIGNGLDETTTLIIASLSGLAMMASMATAFYFMSRLVEDGTFRMNSALGRIGEVYLPIPASGTGIGKIQINVQGTVRELDAMTRDEAPLATGTVVRVTEIVDGHILLVSKNSN